MSSGINNSDNQQHFCLRWNNHRHNILGVLSSVLTSQQHADVSLFCEGNVIRVHKLVLSASSSHFERILEASPPGQQPFIILDGTKYEDLRALLDYMYRGEVNVQQEQLDSLLKTAENLKIKGLIEVATTKQEDDGGGGVDPLRTARELLNSNGSSPSAKRSKNSPSDSASSSMSSRDGREPLQVEPRDLSRDAPRDLSSQFGLNNASGYASTRRPNSPAPIPGLHNLAHSRTLLYSSGLIQKQSHKNQVTAMSNSYFPNNITRPRSPIHNFDTDPVSSLHPPKASPQSILPDNNKVASQLNNINPFGLNFSLPLLHESKKFYDRASHKLISSHYESQREERDRDFMPSAWPPRGASHDLDREMRDKEYRDPENNRRDRSKEREWEREKEKNELNERALRRTPDLQVSQSQMYQIKQISDLQSSQKSPTQQQQFPSQSSLPRLEKMDSSPDSETERRTTEEEKFSPSTEKDSSFSPPDGDANSMSSKTEYTPEGDHHPEEDDDTHIGDIIKDTITSNGEITSTITSTGTNGRSPSSNSTNLSSTDSIKCPYCNRLYRHQNNLRTHIRCFHKGVRIPCPYCPRGFTRWFTVRCHIAREHSGQYSRIEDIPAQLRRAIYPPFTE